VVAGSASAEADSVVPSGLGWQYNWLDALAGTLTLAAELALTPGCGSSGLQALMCDVVPASFVPVVSRVAAEQLEDAALQLQVQRQLLALAFWQQYADLDGRCQQWRAGSGCLGGCSRLPGLDAVSTGW